MQTSKGTRQAFVSMLVVGLFISSSFFILAMFLPMPVKATTDTHTWLGVSSENFGSASNWNPYGAPTAGDNVVITNAGSYHSPHMNQAVTYGNITDTGAAGLVYGVVANVGCNRLTLSYAALGTHAGGTFTIGGDAVFNSGSDITSGASQLLILTGDNKYFNYSISDNLVPNEIDVYGSRTFQRLAGTGSLMVSKWVIGSGAVLTNNFPDDKLSYKVNGGGAASWSNSGTLAGTGKFLMQVQATDTVTFGTITCPLNLDGYASLAASKTVSVGATTTFGSTLLVGSSSGTYTTTLDLTASNFNLNAVGITIGTRGIVNARASTVTCSGSFSSTAGTFTVGTSTLVMSGASKTLTTSASLYNLQLTGSITLAQNTTTTNQLTISGTVTQAGYVLTDSYSSSDALTLSSGHFNGLVKLTASPASFAVPIIAPFTTGGIVWSKVVTTYTNGSNGYVKVTPVASTNGKTHVDTVNYNAGMLNDIAKFEYQPESTGTASFEIKTQASEAVTVKVDGVFYQSGIADPSGFYGWSYNFASTANKLFNAYPPVSFTSTPVTSSWEDHAYSYQAAINDAASAWYLESNASFLSISGSALVSGTPDNTHAAQSFYVHIRATTDSGYLWQNYTLTCANYAPHITSTPLAYASLTHYYLYTSTFDDSAVGGTWGSITTNTSDSYSWSIGHLNWTVEHLGYFWWNYTVNDNSGAGNATTYQNWTVTVTKYVSFLSTPVTTAWEDHAYSYQTVVNRTVNQFILDIEFSWLIISLADGLVTGTPPASAGGHSYAVHIKAVVDEGWDWQNYTLIVANNIPVFTSTPPATNYFNYICSYDASADDEPGVFNFTGTNFPNLEGNYTFDNDTGLLTLNTTAVGVFWFNITFTDNSGADNATIYQNWTMIVSYHNPVFISSPTTEIWWKSFYSYQPVCDGGISLWTFSSDASWLSMDINGTVTGQPSDNNTEHTYHVYISATNWKGTAYQNFTVYVSAYPINRGTLWLPDNVRPYITVIIVFFGLALAVSVVNFAVKFQKRGKKHEDLVQLVIFLIIGFVMMGILIAILGT